MTRRTCQYAASLALAGWIGLLPAYGAPANTTLVFRGSAELPGDLTVAGHRVGGLSGMSYDAAADRYYAVSDDLSAPRIHTLRIDISDGWLDPGDVRALGAVRLLDLDRTPFTPGEMDAEGIALLPDGTLMIASEPTRRGLPSVIRRYDRSGQHLSDLRTDRHRYDARLRPRRGARTSGGYETLFLSGDGRTLFAAFEAPLKQDMSDHDGKRPAPVRLKAYDLATGEKTGEMVYVVGVITVSPDPPDGWAGRGLNDMLWLEHGLFLSVERQFAQGTTSGIRTRPVELFEVRADGATDVRARDRLTGTETPMAKTPLLDLDTLRQSGRLARIGNHETLVVGPRLPDGTESLILIEDNDFERPTQVLLFSLIR